jgi:hypothetical protein
MNKTNERFSSRKFLAGENGQIATSVDKQGTGNNIEQQNSQSIQSNTSKTTYKTPKIWMDFDDFCACFTLVKIILICMNNFTCIFKVRLLFFIILVVINIHRNIQN